MSKITISKKPPKAMILSKKPQKTMTLTKKSQPKIEFNKKPSTSYKKAKYIAALSEVKKSKKK